MAELARPDGTVVHYQVFGDGPAVLALAPGTGGGAVWWERSTFNPIRLLLDEFTIVAVDQRHTGRSTGDLRPFSYSQAAADQIAVLDALELDKVQLLGESIGCACAWRLTQEAPDRIRSIVCINPVGLLPGANSISAYLTLFDKTIRLARADGVAAVVRAAEELSSPNDSGSCLEGYGAAGPFGHRIGSDRGFRAQVSALSMDQYVSLVVRFRDGLWPDGSPWFSVPPEWMTQCDAPMLVLPGNDALHPRGLAEELTRTALRAVSLDERWSTPERLAATVRLVRDFLAQHASLKSTRSVRLSALTPLPDRTGSWSN